jgi:hypothetical protein
MVACSGRAMPVNHPGGMIHYAKRALLRANLLFLKAIRIFYEIWLQIRRRNQTNPRIFGQA